MAIAFLKYLKVKLKIPSLLAACPDCCLVKAFYSHKSTPFHMNPTEFQNFPSLYFSPILYQFCDKEMCDEESNAVEKLDLTPHHRQQATGTTNNQYFIHRKGTKRMKNGHKVRGLRHLLSFFHPFPAQQTERYWRGAAQRMRPRLVRHCHRCRVMKYFH